jgi:thioester reductase-like protein
MIFVTGFPGFLASELMVRLIEKDQSLRFLCLVQPKFKDLATQAVKTLAKRAPTAETQILLVEGDITEAGLGLADTSVFSRITRIFHFAAVYDLSVGEALAKKVNVEGTRNVLQFAKSCSALQRLDYVSTCYVSGRFTGRFQEADLEKGQVFNNFYESTKYEAERLVRAEMAKGLDATIYRPSIVVGNSKTGVTQKFDGPYFVMQWLLRQGHTAFLPRLPNPGRFSINVVPSDYVIDAMTYLASSEASVGKTFQFADPKPLTVREMIHILGIACERTVIGIPLPKGIAKWALKALPAAERFLGIPYSALDYFDHPTQYDVRETLAALSGSGIACPSFQTYAPALVRFMKAHPSLRTKALT